MKVFKQCTDPRHAAPADPIAFFEADYRGLSASIRVDACRLLAIGDESQFRFLAPAFHGQSQHMARLSQQQGNSAECVCVEDSDHFSVLEHVIAQDGRVARQLRDLSGRGAEL